MKIIISPAKKMKTEDHGPRVMGRPRYIDESKKILEEMRKLSFEELMDLWKCSEKLAGENFLRIKEMNPEKNQTAAVIAYEGIQYRYMAPGVFTDSMWRYADSHLRILSGMYGVLKPCDGIVPYRLEMQAQLKTERGENLYQFWGDRLYRGLWDNEEGIEEKSPENPEGKVIVNLASEEYSKAVSAYLKPEDRFIEVVFGELKKGSDDKVVQKATYAKMARGRMVRFMAENQIEDPEGMKGFSDDGFSFCERLSDENRFVFLRSEE